MCLTFLIITGLLSFKDFLGSSDWPYGEASMGPTAPCVPSMPVVNPVAGPEVRALCTAEANVPPPPPPTLFRVCQARYVHPSARGRTRFGRASNVNRDMVSFRMNGSPQDGIPLKLASMNFVGTAMGLVEADELVLLDPGIGVNVTLHVLVSLISHLSYYRVLTTSFMVSLFRQWPGYKPWTRLLRTKTWSNPPKAISRAELAKRLARALISFTKVIYGLVTTSSRKDSYADIFIIYVNRALFHCRRIHLGLIHRGSL